MKKDLAPTVVVERTVSGSAEQCSLTLGRLARAGVLVSSTPLVPHPTRPGMMMAAIRLYADEIGVPRTPRRSPYRRYLLVGGIVLAGLGGLAVGGYLLLNALATAAGGAGLVLVLALGAGLAFAARSRRSRGCPGVVVHCAHDRRH